MSNAKLTNQQPAQRGECDNPNATRNELEQLNGLLVRELIRKLQHHEASATDIGNAVKVVISNRVLPEEPEGHLGYDNGIPETALDWPVKVDG